MAWGWRPRSAARHRHDFPTSPVSLTQAPRRRSPRPCSVRYWTARASRPKTRTSRRPLWFPRRTRNPRAGSRRPFLRRTRRRRTRGRRRIPPSRRATPTKCLLESWLVPWRARAPRACISVRSASAPLRWRLELPAARTSPARIVCRAGASRRTSVRCARAPSTELCSTRSWTPRTRRGATSRASEEFQSSWEIPAAGSQSPAATCSLFPGRRFGPSPNN